MEPPPGSPAEADRRDRGDRRRRRTPMLSRYWLRGRRRGGRRDGERADLYVDRYSATEWALATALLVLGLADGLWTVAHLGRGVQEANPLMAWVFAAAGAPGFVAAKVAVTVLAAGFLLLHSRFRLTRALLPLAVLCYALLLGVHVATELTIRSA